MRAKELLLPCTKKPPEGVSTAYNEMLKYCEDHFGDRPENTRIIYLSIAYAQYSKAKKNVLEKDPSLAAPYNLVKNYAEYFENARNVLREIFKDAEDAVRAEEQEELLQRIESKIERTVHRYSIRYVVQQLVFHIIVISLAAIGFVLVVKGVTWALPILQEEAGKVLQNLCKLGKAFCLLD